MIGFIGTGNMVGAIINGMISSHAYTPDEIIVYDKVLSDNIKSLNVRTGTLKETVQKSDYIIIAVKPNIICDVLCEISEIENIGEKVFISIAAGVTISTIESHLSGCKIIRVMPNLCLKAGNGMSVIAPGNNVNSNEIADAEKIFACSGKTAVIKESLIDACTAISGSGPAYVFMFIEALADSAVKHGIDRKTAYLLASQTVLGSASLCLETNEHPAVLKDMVCSPGGTTIEAVEVLEKEGLRGAIMDAVDACAKKASSLGK